MLKIASLIGRLRVKARDAMLCLLTAFGSTLLPGQFALGTLKPSLGLPIPSGVPDLLSSREGGERFEAYVDPDFGGCGRIGSGRDLGAGEDRIPLSSLMLDRAGLRGSFDGSVKLDLDPAYSGKAKALRPNEPEPNALRPSETIVAISPLEAGVPRRLSVLHATEEVLESKIYPMKGLLENLRIDLSVFGTGILNERKLSRLVLEVDRYAVLPRLTPFFDGGVVEFVATVEPAFERGDLGLGGIQAKLVRPPESSYNGVSHDELLFSKGLCGQEPRPVQAGVGFDYYGVRYHVSQEASFIPMPEGRGFRSSEL